MKTMRKISTLIFSLFAISVLTWGVYSAIHSPLFQLTVVEVADQPENAPLTAQAITDLAQISTGSVNLFDLDLESVEKKIRANEWIREVRMLKRFPQTLAIAVSFREPSALLQSGTGSLAYVDSDGKSFGSVNLIHRSDLPLLSGFSREKSNHRIIAALRFIEQWERSSLGEISQIASLNWDSSQGYRALVTYPLQSDLSRKKSRTLLELGQDFGDPLQMERLFKVFQYLTLKSIAAHQIWADIGKKIVVRTAHGS